MKLQDILKEIKSYPGIVRKGPIGRVADVLKGLDEGISSRVVTKFGEDAAAIRYQNHYLLLAAEGMWPQFVNAEPYAAGKAAVMASVNDIYSMGGRPLAMVNVISSTRGDDCLQIMEGIRKGCQKLKVPMVGGHLNPDGSEPALAVAILGTARKLLQSTNARPGQSIVFAVDLDGMDGQCKSVVSWDANSGKTSEYVIDRLEILRTLAEQDICQTAKDVSNGGILGTIALLCECSRVGCAIMLNDIPKPPGVELLTWVKSFLSYGFILCVDVDNISACLESFRKKGISAEVIGKVRQEPCIVLNYGEDEGVLYDFSKESILGV
jgi:selenophosphate synthetase-related protein